MTVPPPDPTNLLVIRLGAMGDILHALPAVASLKKSFPGSRIAWLLASKWMPLLTNNPHVDELITFDRGGLSSLRSVRRRLQAFRADLAIDFQGLLQSAILGRLAAPASFWGFGRSVAREPLAAMFYSDTARVTGPHRIERNLQLVAALGARTSTKESWVPAGVPEGTLPSDPFVLVSPFAGWASKQWPIDHYDELGRRLAREGLRLVANVPRDRTGELSSFKNLFLHSSSIDGLIDATRRSLAVVGVDSGPLHLAAALQKPGVALFGPTDPAQTGPFNSPIRVLRRQSVQTTYKRGRSIDASMSAISADEVTEELMHALASLREPASSVVRNS